MTTRTRYGTALELQRVHTRDVVARYLAPKLGMTVNAAHGLLVSGQIEHRYACGVEAHIEAGADARLERFMAGSERVLARRPIDALTLHLLTGKVVADNRENVAIVEFAARIDCEETAVRYLRHLYHEQAEGQRLIRSICARFGRRA